MRRVILILFVAILGGIWAASAVGNATLTSDPLTGLPLIPATHSPMDSGNDPTVMPESTVCKSKFKGNFYSVFNTKVDATVAWYAARLAGFRKTHAYAAGRSQDLFYKPDGTVFVGVTGEPGAAGENKDTYAVMYGTMTPGLPEKSIIGMNAQKIVCQ
jgi:hypothetical protein